MHVPSFLPWPPNGRGCGGGGGDVCRLHPLSTCVNVDGFRTGDDGETDGDFRFCFSGGVSSTWPWISCGCDIPKERNCKIYFYC